MGDLTILNKGLNLTMTTLDWEKNGNVTRKSLLRCNVVLTDCSQCKSNWVLLVIGYFVPNLPTPSVGD